MSHRDDVRAERSFINGVAKELGVNLDSERSKTGANERTLVYEAMKLVNTQTPRTTREQLQVDDPPSGAFNGVNTSFALTAPVVGQNIIVVWHDSTNNVQRVLTKSNTNPPATLEFFFDSSTPDQIVVGNAPAVGDGLVAIFKVER